MDCQQIYPKGVGSVLSDLVQQSFLIFLGLLGEDDIPTHQPGEFDDCSKDSAIPSRMDSLIPGTERRKRVSCMILQSSSETRTALAGFPVI